MNENVKTKELFSTENEYIKPFFEKFEFPWQILPEINKYINALFSKKIKGYFFMDDDVLMGENVRISPTAIIKGPAIIGANTEICAGAVINRNVIIGEKCVIGISAKLCNCVLCDNVQLAHCNYISNSILGESSHIGATAVCSDLKCDGSDADVCENTAVLLGDNTEIGSGCVLASGTVIGKNTAIAPLTALCGVYPENAIIKSSDDIVENSIK